MTLTENKRQHPPPHAKYLVSRDGWHFVATPCYGMHHPWWVSAICGDENRRETDPVAMLDSDKWVPLNDVLANIATG